jgi:phosphate transport system protein
MREGFAAHLAELEGSILDDLGDAASALGAVSVAVADPGTQRIEAIDSAGQMLRSRAAATHVELVTVAARQAPVATELRLLLAMIELSHNTTLIGNQFKLIGKQLARIDASDGDPENAIAEQLALMASLAGSQLRQAIASVRTRDLAAATGVEALDDRLDVLNREVANAALRNGATQQERNIGFRYVLIARSLERIGDNAVDIAEQVAFLLTGQRREFTDASQPRTDGAS